MIEAILSITLLFQGVVTEHKIEFKSFEACQTARELKEFGYNNLGIQYHAECLFLELPTKLTKGIK